MAGDCGSPMPNHKHRVIKETLMRSSRWQSFNPVWNQLQQFQEEMNHLFNRWHIGDAFASPSAFPSLNVWEDGEEVYVEAELPGLDLKDLEIYVTGGNQLILKG